MNFRSVAASLRVSCYNCRYFQVGDDMMNGTCRYGDKCRSTIGIGTCDDFMRREAESFAWSRLKPRSRPAQSQN